MIEPVGVVDQPAKFWPALRRLMSLKLGSLSLGPPLVKTTAAGVVPDPPLASKETFFIQAAYKIELPESALPAM
jgi:hypothetical protein